MQFLGYTIGDANTQYPEPTPEQYARMGEFIEEATKAGMLLATGGLAPADQATKVIRSGGEFTVVDGPFTEAKELIGGYWLIQARSKEEAVEWASRCPANDGDVIEVRQVYEMSDFEDAA